MNQDPIEQIFSSMINYFRAETEKLNEQEKECIQTLSSLNNPCQLHVISSFDHNRHLLIKTHFSELEDKSIRTTQLKQDVFATQLREIIEDSMWSNQKKESKSRHDIPPWPDELTQIIIRFGQSIYQSAHYQATANYQGLGVQMLIHDQIVIWEFGKMEGWDFRKEVTQFVSGYKHEADERKKTAMKNSTTSKQGQLPIAAQTKTENEQAFKHLPGFGTCFYPPILIEELVSTVEDQIYQRYEKLAKNVCVARIDNMTVAVSKGGVIGIQTHDSEEAEKILNTIMAVTLVSGLPAHFVRKSEIAHINFEKDTFEMRASQWMMSSIRMQMFSSLMSFGMEHQEDTRVQIPLEMLELIINHCKEVLNAPEKQKLLELLLSGYTLLENDSYAQSFLASWTIMELHLYSLWADKLASAGVTRKTREDLSRWSLYHVLEILHVDKLVTEDDYNDLKRMQKLRNDVTHEGYVITKKQAEECYRMASTLVKEKTGIATVADHTKTVRY